MIINNDNVTNYPFLNKKGGLLNCSLLYLKTNTSSIAAAQLLLVKGKGHFDVTLSSCINVFEFPPQKEERKGGWEPSFALNLTLNFRALIQPYSSGLLKNFCGGGWAWLPVSKSERQRTSGPQKRSKSDFIYCPQHVLALSRKLAKTLGAGEDRTLGTCFCAP